MLDLTFPLAMDVANGSPTIEGCEFQLNDEAAIGAVDSSITVLDSIFYSNDWGGILLDGGSASISGSQFIDHPNYGGATIYSGGTAEFTDCTFEGNDSTYGGAIGVQYSTATVTGCTFLENSADWGGAISNEEGTVTVIDSTFMDNEGKSQGGAMYNGLPSIGSDVPIVSISDATFSNNSAGDAGGGIHSVSAVLTITDSEFLGNSSGWRGGTMSKATVAPSRTSARTNTYRRTRTGVIGDWPNGRIS